MEYSGTGGKLIHEKTRSKKSCDTVPLSVKRLTTLNSFKNFKIKTYSEVWAYLCLFNGTTFAQI